MDRKLFISDSAGVLRKISLGGEKDWAFIPNPLPTKWEIPSEIWPLLTEAREELARLDGVGRHMPNHEILLQPLKNREALRSSSLEGTYATPEQLLFFEIDPKEPKSLKDPVNAWKEVSNYSKALNRGQERLHEIPISLRLIREIHNELLSGVRGHQKAPGEFRRNQVHIGSNRRFVPPPPDELKNCLYDLENSIHQDNKIDPLIFCFMVHYQFETIHPFLDGNGRVGRLLLSLMIFQRLELVCPWLYLSAFFERYKDEYIDNLFNVSARNDWDRWIAFCLRGTIDQARDAIRRFDHLIEIQAKFQAKIHSRGGNVRLIQTIRSLFEIPMISIPILAKRFNVSPQTARNDINCLVEEGILADSGLSRHPIIFMAPEIINTAYTELEDG